MLVKLPSAVIALAPVSVVPPVDEPVRVVAVMTSPAPWEIVPAELSVTVWPGAEIAVFSVKLLPTPVVVRVRAPVPASTTPVTVKVCALVRLKAPAPLLVKVSRLVMRFAPPKLAPPTDEPVRVPAVMTLVAAWVIAPPALSWAIPPVVRLALIANAPGVVSVRGPTPAAIAPLTVRPVGRVSLKVKPPGPLFVNPRMVAI